MMGEGSLFEEVADRWRETRAGGMLRDLRVDERVDVRYFERDRRWFERWDAVPSVSMSREASAAMMLE